MKGRGQIDPSPRKNLLSKNPDPSFIRVKAILGSLVIVLSIHFSTFLVRVHVSLAYNKTDSNNASNVLILSELS